MAGSEDDDGGHAGPRPPKGALRRVAVVDDHQFIAESVAAALDAEPGFCTVGTAGSISMALALVRDRAPELVVMDYRLPDGTGADATRRLLAEDPKLRVLLLTAHDALDVLADAIDAGCAAFLPKTVSLDAVVGAVRAVADGDTVFDLGMLGRLAAPPRVHARRTLTYREVEVLRLLSYGLGTRQVAEDLFVSVHTVRKHVRNITAKLDVHSKLEAVALALREGIVDA